MTQFNVASYASPQAAVNALQSAGGGQLYVPAMYNLTSPLAFSGLVPTEVVGDGAETGFNYTGPAGNNLIQISSAPTWGAGSFKISNLALTQNTGIANITGIFINMQESPYFDHVFFRGFQTSLWVVNTYALNFNACQWASCGSLGFDPATPANNVVFMQCKVFGSTQPFICLNLGCNGLYLRDGDYENNPGLIQILGGTPNTIVCSENDIEALTGEMIQSSVPINDLQITSNTFGNNVGIDLGNSYNCTGLIVNENNLYNTAMTIKATNCSAYQLGANNLQSGGSITVV